MKEDVNIRADGGDVLVDVKVVPGASRTRLAGTVGKRVKIQVAAPPEKGKANTAVEELVAKLCGVRKRDVAVVAGVTSPAKTLRISSVSEKQVCAALGLSK